MPRQKSSGLWQRSRGRTRHHMTKNRDLLVLPSDLEKSLDYPSAHRSLPEAPPVCANSIKAAVSAPPLSQLGTSARPTSAKNESPRPFPGEGSRKPRRRECSAVEVERELVRMRPHRDR